MGVARKEALDKILPAVHYDVQMHPWPQKTWLEIGFGFGEHLLEQMDSKPLDGFIGVEVFENGLAHFLTQLKAQDYWRCRLFPYCASQLSLPEAFLDGIFILFPNPWPKKGHHKRRLLQSFFLDRCYRWLKPEGCLYIASDHVDLTCWMLHQLANHTGFTFQEGVDQENPTLWPSWPASWPLSRYQQKASLRGARCAHMVWKKKNLYTFSPMEPARATQDLEDGALSFATPAISRNFVDGNHKRPTIVWS